jgi:predicted CoA-binding protein
MRDSNLYGTDEVVVDLLTNANTIAVVGLGTDPEKPVYRVAEFLQRKGKRVIPIHPREIDVLGEKTYPSLTAAVNAGEQIDMVDCFVASQRVGQIMNEAVDLGLPALWLQLDIVDETAAAHARGNGLQVVMDRCPAIEWPRLMADREL